ncbi:hypothetical protein GmHk_11G031143 [Glycine max]|nr:hypothetical protein GmHk_11G031143 [Glycine max]
MIIAQLSFREIAWRIKKFFLLFLVGIFGRLVQWQPPQPGEHKLNVNGNSIGNLDKVGFGGLICDNHAIYRGINVAWPEGVHHLTCESNSKVALQLITNGVISSYSFHPLIQNIKSFLHLHWKTTLRHSIRE